MFDLFGGLLGQANPALLCAAGFSSSPHFMYSGNYTSGDRAGEWFQLYSIGFGGIPGRPLGDGPDGHSLWPSFVNIPCEYPLRIERCETVPDTGGPGLHRAAATAWTSHTCSPSPGRSRFTTTVGLPTRGA